MKNLIQAAVVTLFAASTVQAQQAVQWKASDGGNGHWYGMKPIDYSRSWSDLIVSSAQLGGAPALLSSSSDAAWISSHVVIDPPGDGALLGAELVQESGGGLEWRWIDGTAFSPAVPWCGGAPGGPASVERWVYMNDQAHVHSTAPAGCLDDCPWSGWSSINVPWAVIEWSADCNNDGIVDYGQCHDGSLPDYNGNNIPDCCERGETCVVGNYPVQWRVEDGGNGHWYQLVFEGHPSWTQAKSQAEQRGGYLATLTSQAESALAGRLSRGLPAMLLGGFQDHSSPSYSEPAGGWRWVTDEPWTFTNWGSGEPNNASNGHGDPGEDYLSSWTGAQGFKWGDGDNLCPECNPGPFLVEWSADCNNDGIVDYGQILQGTLADNNADGIPDVCQQPTCRDADIYRDFNVNGADLGILLSQWGPVTPLTQSDFNHDGRVDGADLGFLLANWGACP